MTKRLFLVEQPFCGIADKMPEIGEITPKSADIFQKSQIKCQNRRNNFKNRRYNPETADKMPKPEI
ncbi:hypothetical protein ACFQ9Y_12925 [Peribacillus simplex]|uniref:hypothetical protein n=1 Tax=Peribacillus simplex TaxID=1478 RepID=UPI00366B732C